MLYFADWVLIFKVRNKMCKGKTECSTLSIDHPLVANISENLGYFKDKKRFAGPLIVYVHPRYMSGV